MAQTGACTDREAGSVIAVIGAAGQNGTRLLEVLRRADVRVRAVVHSAAGGERARAAGADETVPAELADPSTLRAALDGADAAYMIPPPFDPDEHLFATTALRAAEAAGARRFVYVSVLHPHTPALRHHMRKAEAEATIRDSGLAWTILQPSIYAQQVWTTFGSAPPGPVRVPFDPAAGFSAIDLYDLAEVGATVLTERGHECATYELCGPRQTLAEMVGIAGRVRGVALDPTRVAPSEAPMPPQFAERPSMAADVRAMWDEYDRHGFLGNSNVLRMLLGREPATFEAVARCMLAKAA